MKLAKDQIARQFSRAAATYDLAAQLQNEMAETLIAAIPAGATGELADLGCGTGWALERLSRTGRFELTAVDIAPGMIEFARDRVPGAKFHCCDLEVTPLASDSVDVVFSNAAVQWCNFDRAVGEMQRIGKPRAQIVCSTFGPKTMLEIRSAWQATDDQADRIHEFESCQSIESILRRRDLENVSVDSVIRTLTFDSVDELLQSIKRLGATNASVGRRTGLMGTDRFKLFQQVLEHRLEHDGHLELTFECIYAFAENSDLETGS